MLCTRPPAGFNTLLRHLDPLIISLACNMEPLLGSLMGWAAGVLTAPGAWTYVGGGLVLASTATVSIASHRREKRQASKEAASRAIQHILSGGSDAEAGAAGGSGSAAGRRFDSAAAEVGGDGGWGDGWPQLKERGKGSSASSGWEEQTWQPAGGQPPDRR